MGRSEIFWLGTCCHQHGKFVRRATYCEVGKGDIPMGCGEHLGAWRCEHRHGMVAKRLGRFCMGYPTWCGRGSNDRLGKLDHSTRISARYARSFASANGSCVSGEYPYWWPNYWVHRRLHKRAVVTCLRRIYLVGCWCVHDDVDVEKGD